MWEVYVYSTLSQIKKRFFLVEQIKRFSQVYEDQG